MKTCSRGLHQYESNPARRGCRECHKATAKVYAQRPEGRRAQVVATQKWQRNNPEKNAANISAFSARRRTDEWRAARRERRRWTSEDAAKYRAWRESNPQKAREKYSRWSKANPEKVREKSRVRRARLKVGVGQRIGEPQLEALYEKQGGLCAYCSRSLDNGRHLDHRTPIARGGHHELANLSWSCPPCNLRKSTKTAEEFVAAMECAA